MDAVDKSGSPPADLVMSWQCEKYNALPEAGGLLDQDAGRMARMSSLANVYRTVARLRNMQGEQIHSLTTGERKIIKRLREEGLMR